MMLSSKDELKIDILKTLLNIAKMEIDYKGYLIEYTTIPEKLLGGQSVSPVHQDLKVVVKDLGIDMTITTFRSNVKNRDLAIKIIDLIINEVTEDFNKKYNYESTT